MLRRTGVPGWKPRSYLITSVLTGLILFGPVGSASATLVMPGTPLPTDFVLGPTVPGKWGPPALGTPATVSWSLMPDGTPAPADPFPHPGGSSLFASILGPLGPGATAAISSAFATWAAVTSLTIVGPVPDAGLAFDHPLATGAAAGDIRFGGYPFDGAFRVLAHAFFPPVNGFTAAGDAHFDMAESWVISALPEGSPTGLLIDWETVVLHELGHALGLDHSPVPLSVMFATYSGVHRILDPDDILGIQTLYGVPAGVPEPSTFLLIGSALLGVGLWRCRQDSRRRRV